MVAFTAGIDPFSRSLKRWVSCWEGGGGWSEEVGFLIKKNGVLHHVRLRLYHITWEVGTYRLLRSVDNRRLVD